MAASNRGDLRDLIRRKIRDEDETDYVFTDAELNTSIATAIRAYSKLIPREVSDDFAITAGVDEYDAPDGIRKLISIKDGDTEYVVSEIFGGKITLESTPETSVTATIKYLGTHTLPAADDEASTYDEIDESLIVLHVIAQCWETLAGDGARYYDYQEGDIRENQGKTQAQFRTEADKLYGEFNAGVAKSKLDQDALKPAHLEPVFVDAVSRKAASRSTTIYRS